MLFLTSKYLGSLSSGHMILRVGWPVPLPSSSVGALVQGLLGELTATQLGAGPGKGIFISVSLFPTPSFHASYLSE